METSKHRTVSFVDGAVLPDNKLVVIGSDDAAVLAVLSSELHLRWALRAGGWLGFGNDPVYVKTAIFDPFPFPPWNALQRAALVAAGERLDGFRKARLAEHPGLTLTRLYNALEAHRAAEAGARTGRAAPAIPARITQDMVIGAVAALEVLHRNIDRLTLDAYRWTDLLAVADPAAREEAMLGALVALNAERIREETSGEVRWLRPAFQETRARLVRAAGQTHR